MTDQQTPSFLTPDGQKLRVREVHDLWLFVPAIAQRPL